MKNKNNNSKHFHQHVESILRHRMSLAIVTGSMFMTVLSFDGSVRGVMQQAYAQSWDWIATYLHHEHPKHAHVELEFSRHPTIAGSGPS